MIANRISFPCVQAIQAANVMRQIRRSPVEQSIDSYIGQSKCGRTRDMIPIDSELQQIKRSGIRKDQHEIAGSIGFDNRIPRHIHRSNCVSSIFLPHIEPSQIHRRIGDRVDGDLEMHSMHTSRQVLDVRSVLQKISPGRVRGVAKPTQGFRRGSNRMAECRIARTFGERQGRSNRLGQSAHRHHR